MSNPRFEKIVKGCEELEDLGFGVIVKEAGETVERSAWNGGKKDGPPIEQEVSVNVISKTGDEPSRIVSTYMQPIPSSPGETSFEAPETQEPESTVPEVETLIEEQAKEAQASKTGQPKCRVVLETPDLEMRAVYEAVTIDEQSSTASIVYDPESPSLNLPVRNRPLRILCDDHAPFRAVYEGVDFEIPRSSGLRLRNMRILPPEEDSDVQ